MHDFRRGAIRNLMKAGTSERVAMSISGRKTRSVFDRHHSADTEDVEQAIKWVEQSSMVSLSEETVQNRQKVATRKLLIA